MRRRDAIAVLLGTILARPPAALAQRVRRIGILMPYPETDAELQARVGAFKQELARLGWREGESLRFEAHWTTDDMDRVRAGAAELVRLEPELILTTGSRVVTVLQRQTRSIPILFAGASDPVGQGFVASLARPGGNTTGFSLLELSGAKSPIIGKMMELVREIAPAIERIALVFNPANPATAFHARSFQESAGAMGLAPTVLQVGRSEEIEHAIEVFAREPNGAMVFPSDVTTLTHRELVVAQLARHRLPAIFGDRIIVTGGGLISYSADRTDMFRRAASYADRILRGESPADLPVQQPTTYELIVNLRTARSLGLPVPPSIMLRADEVVE